LRAWRPGGWAPQIDVIGADNVSAALIRGRGIIFWGGNFSFNNLVAKMAMHRLGLAVVGFSVPRHGFSHLSKTTFAVRYLNKIVRDIENRFLQERLMTEPDAFPAALQQMRDCLKGNGTVYFRVGNRAHRTATAKFLGDRIILATAPLAMAHTMGAAMLPVYTRRVGPSWYEVTIGPPIDVPQDADGNSDYTAAVQAYADALTPFVLRDPGQWDGWHLVTPHAPWKTTRGGPTKGPSSTGRPAASASQLSAIPYASITYGPVSSGMEPDSNRVEPRGLAIGCVWGGPLHSLGKH
jgi:lauroyl/myristoyl acyltransferase